MKFVKMIVVLLLAMFFLNVNAGSPGKALNISELQKVLVGHTYPISNGGIYFPSANEAIILWKGKIENVKWHATNDSKFCYAAVLFGGKEECIGLTRTADGNYVHDYYGKYRTINASKIKKGKTF